MTTLTLIEQLQPGELVVRCADGSLVRTLVHGFQRGGDAVASGNGRKVRRLLSELSALKQRARKR